MKLPYGYVLIGKEIVIHEEKADVVRSIFDDYLAGASLGKIVDLLFKKGVVSPTGKVKWTRVRTPLCKISSTGEIEQRFRLN